MGLREFRLTGNDIFAVYKATKGLSEQGKKG